MNTCFVLARILDGVGEFSAVDWSLVAIGVRLGHDYRAPLGSPPPREN